MNVKRVQRGDSATRTFVVAIAVVATLLIGNVVLQSLYQWDLYNVVVLAGSNSWSSADNDISKNEGTYDADYWNWQASLNKFGAAYKGDIIRHLISGLSPAPQTILEFGCSGGYILDSMPVEHKYGVELNPASRAYAKDTFPNIKHVFPRIENIPQGLLFDVIFTTSVLEHVDCPLCELSKFKSVLKPGGVVIVGLKNDGADLQQTFASYKHEQNHHIYTWNSLLLANMLDSAEFTPCNVIGQFDAWHAIDVELYNQDKHAYCVEGLEKGKAKHVYNMWAIAVKSDAACHDYSARLNQILDCQYLLNPTN